MVFIKTHIQKVKFTYIVMDEFFDIHLKVRLLSTL